MPDATPKAYQCRHIFADGRRCGSKSLRNETFCFYHHTIRRPAPRPTAQPATEAFDLPFVEDRPTIQIAIAEILRRIAANAIDPRRAGLLLYGLQIASINLPNQRKPNRGNDREEQIETVEDIEAHPELGPLAPIAEFEQPEEDLSHAGRILRMIEETDHADREAEARRESESNDLPTLQSSAACPRRPRPSRLTPTPPACSNCPFNAQHDPGPPTRKANRTAHHQEFSPMHGLYLVASLLQTVVPDAQSAGASDGRIYLWIAIAVALVALGLALLLARAVIASDSGTPEMQLISNAIREGAEAFLKRQYQTIGVIAAVLAVVVFIGYHASDRTAPYAAKTVISFLVGAVCSGLAGFTGMYCSIRANIRAASAARSSLDRALKMALRGGAVTGLVVVALSLLGVSALFLLFGGLDHPREVPFQLVGFGFGASLVALFAQLGGGIYTKAADVGADLVGKVEAGIPEDDPRNPAVIADLVGDNVGDCAGRGADIFESTAAENVGAMILGAALYPVFGLKGILFPLIVLAINLIASIVGVFVVSTNETEDPMRALNRGFYVTSVLALIGFAAAVYTMLNGPGVAPIWLFACGITGLVTAFLFVWITQYYTKSQYRPVQSIVKASLTGPATNIISGLAVGMETPAIPVIVISAALLLSYYFGVQGLAGVASVGNFAKGIYGTAIATMGMLACAAYILAMDTFGPITDNAGGIIEMSNQPESVRDRTDKLDSAGNTTKALTKGYAIGSASLAAFLLFSAYLEEIKTLVTEKLAVAHAAGLTTSMPVSWSFNNINLAQIPVFVGALLGAMLTYLFSSLAIKAVGRTAQMVVQDVRDQFREDPGIMAGTAKPNYARCVSIVTSAALKEMVLPGLLAVGLPVAVGFIFKHFSQSYQANASIDSVGAALVPTISGLPVNLAGAEAVAGLLMVGTISGVLLAMLMNNGGGAWDNAKKYIETGQYGGKKSDAHKAAVVGDTVGDPFKDTAGPSLHVLIKLLATITLVLAPLFV